ncbi:conserved exported hypothetical protein [Syntrophobacter sp. SbD1]|nr:conserved exported hypothetical protein [Syntrophobacter sp. SbD1]
MKAKKWLLCLGVASLLAGACARSATADLYWETESISTNVPHQPNGTSIQKYYFTSTASRVELGGSKVFIVDYSSMELYTLDTKAKTCTHLNLTELAGLPGMAPADKQKMAEMIGSMMGIQITRTGELKNIAGYKCRKYKVHIAMVNGEYWVSQDVKGYKELRCLGAKMGVIADRNPMLKQMHVAGIVDKLGGFPVYTVNHVMGGTVESTLKKVEEKSLDPGLFTVPKDYAIKKHK